MPICLSFTHFKQAQLLLSINYQQETPQFQTHCQISWCEQDITFASQKLKSKALRTEEKNNHKIWGMSSLYTASPGRLHITLNRHFILKLLLQIFLSYDSTFETLISIINFVNLTSCNILKISFSRFAGSENFIIHQIFMQFQHYHQFNVISLLQVNPIINGPTCKREMTLQ